MRQFAILTISALTLSACVEITTQSGDNFNRVVDIVNGSDVTITEFYSRNAASLPWGNDKFATNDLISGQYQSMVFEDGTGACIFDFKAILSTGRETRRDNINVCVDSSWTVF